MKNDCPKCGRRSYYLRIGNAFRECCATCGDWLSDKTEEVKTEQDKKVIKAAVKLVGFMYGELDFRELVEVIEKHDDWLNAR